MVAPDSRMLGLVLLDPLACSWSLLKTAAHQTKSRLPLRYLAGNRPASMSVGHCALARPARTGVTPRINRCLARRLQFSTSDVYRPCSCTACLTPLVVAVTANPRKYGVARMECGAIPPDSRGPIGRLSADSPLRCQRMSRYFSVFWAPIVAAGLAHCGWPSGTSNVPLITTGLSAYIPRCEPFYRLRTTSDGVCEEMIGHVGDLIYCHDVQR